MKGTWEGYINGRWDSGERFGDLNKVCGRSLSQLVMSTWTGDKGWRDGGSKKGRREMRETEEGKTEEGVSSTNYVILETL